MRFTNMVTIRTPWPSQYLKARAEVGTPEGDAFAGKLAAMSPIEAALEIGGMFTLCCDDDLAGEIATDLGLYSDKYPGCAEKIALAIIAGRAGANWEEYLRWKREVDAGTDAWISGLKQAFTPPSR
jgi:hypothetical protein